MRNVPPSQLALVALAVLLSCCSGVERDNPLDPSDTGEAGPTPPTETAAPPPLQLSLPIPKALLSVVDSVVAILEGPGIVPVIKEFSVSPLGPARCTIGALQTGTDRTLTIRGYDLQGELLFQGRQENITIAVGETTNVIVQLELTQALSQPDDGTDLEDLVDGADDGDDEQPADGGSEEEPANGDSGDGANDEAESAASDSGEQSTDTGEANQSGEPDAAGEGDSGSDAEESGSAGG